MQQQSGFLMKIHVNVETGAGGKMKECPAGEWGGVCPARARRANLVLSIPTLTLDLPSPRRAPQVNQEWTTHLPYKGKVHKSK